MIWRGIIITKRQKLFSCFFHLLKSRFFFGGGGFFHLRLFLRSIFECPRYPLSVSTCPSIVHSSSGWMKSIREDTRVAWGRPTWLHPAPSGHICLPVSYLRVYWLRLPDKGQCCPVLDRWGGGGCSSHTTMSVWSCVSVCLQGEYSFSDKVA